MAINFGISMYSAFRRACAALRARRAFALALALLLASRADLLTRVDDLGGVPGLIIICSDIIMSNLQKNLANAKAHQTKLRFKLRTATGRKANEFRGELNFTSAYIANVEARLELARVISNIQNRRSRAATKIQSVWRGSTERQRTRTMRGHKPQSPPR